MTCSLAQARFTRSMTVSAAGSLTIPPRQPLSPSARKDRWRSRTVPASGRTHQALAGVDSIWLTGHWTVQHISHLYDDGVATGSDHALVVTDLATA